MRAMPFLLLGLLLLAPAQALVARSPNQVPGNHPGVWQMACTVVFEAAGETECRDPDHPWQQGSVMSADTISVHLVGKGLVTVYLDRVVPGGVSQVPGSYATCVRDCVLTFAPITGTIHLVTPDLRGDAGTVVRVSVGIGTSGVLV